MRFKNLKYKKLKRIIIVICSSLLIITIIILVVPKKSLAYPSLPLNRFKSILKNLTNRDSKLQQKGTINIKELIEKQRNKNICQKKMRSFRLLIKDLRRKYFKKYFRKKPYPFNFELNKKKIILDRREILLSQRTTKLSTLLERDRQLFENNFKHFFKFMWPYYYREQGIDISNFFSYSIEIVDSFSLLPNIHPVRFLIDDPVYLDPLKQIDFGTFNYSNLKSPELLKLGNPWF